MIQDHVWLPVSVEGVKTSSWILKQMCCFLIFWYLLKRMKSENSNGRICAKGAGRGGLESVSQDEAIWFDARSGLFLPNHLGTGQTSLIKSQVSVNVVVNSALMDMYFKCSSPNDGVQIFDKSVERNVLDFIYI
ncbi:hypothetical protein ACS0TY_010183 [Phlomoides rotata]